MKIFYLVMVVSNAQRFSFEFVFIVRKFRKNSPFYKVKWNVNVLLYDSYLNFFTKVKFLKNCSPWIIVLWGWLMYCFNITIIKPNSLLPSWTFFHYAQKSEWAKKYFYTWNVWDGKIKLDYRFWNESLIGTINLQIAMSPTVN